MKKNKEILELKIDKLIEDKNFEELKKLLSTLHPSDIADLLENMDKKYAAVILRALPASLQSEVFSELNKNTAEQIIKEFSDKEIRELLLELAPNDRTKLFEEISPKITRYLVNLLPPKERQESLELLGYPKNSVGRLMTPEYIAIKPYWTIKKAMEHIKKYGKDAETIDMIYVVDDNWRLLDDIPIRRLILADLNETVESIMDHHFVAITADADQEEAIKLFEKYNLIALPVIDNKGLLLGMVIVNDIIDALQEEQTEDFTKFAAVEAESIGLDTITKIKEVPVTKIIKARIAWLFSLLIMDFITGGIIQSFDNMLAKYVVLVTFLPVLADTAGNAGSQSATLVIRALALGTIKLKDWTYLLGKEFLVSGGLGILMGLGISVMGIIRGKSLVIALVVVTAMILNVIIGSMIGLILPFIFTKLKKDPATASTPLITTLADIISTFIYLGIASIILGR